MIFSPSNVGIVLMMAMPINISQTKTKSLNLAEASKVIHINPYKLQITHGVTHSKKAFIG